MTVVTVDLAGFLLARIEEDEAAAREAFSDAGHWEGDIPNMTFVVETPDDGSWTALDHPADEGVVEGIGIHIYAEGGHNGNQAAHIARWDPARVLAECEAKRAIADRWRAIYDNTGWSDEFDGLTLALRLLAVPYADHPDYREEWKP